MEGKLRKQTKEEAKEFDAVNQKLDEIGHTRREEFKNKAKESHVRMKDTIYMTISDVAKEDADWFKSWCDKYVGGKQFLGIKVMRLVVERIEPLLINVINQINQHEERLRSLENHPEPTSDKLVIPKTQSKKEIKEEN